MMKVLMYGWEFPPYISGGLGVACQAMVAELEKKGIDITLVLPMEVKIHNGADCNLSIIGCASKEILNTTTIRRTPFTTYLNPYFSGFSSSIMSSAKDLVVSRLDFIKRNATKINLTGKYGMNLLWEVFYYAAIAGKLAQEIEHDVIHAHDWLTILAGVEAKKYSHKPLIFHIHALETDRGGLLVNNDIFAIEKYGMEQADQVVAVSEYTKKCIVNNYHIDPNKIAIVHNGTYADKSVARPKVAQEKNVKNVLFVGRLTNQKGPNFFIEAAKKVVAFRQDVKFILVGTGDLMRDLIEKVATLGIGQYVHFAGFLAPGMVDAVYGAADLYIMPSVSEPFGLTCLEALSRDVPVIISKQSGASEVLHHVLKVDFWDVNEMTNKILAVFNYPPLVRTMLTNAKRELTNLTWDKTADAIIQLYAACCGK